MLTLKRICALPGLDACQSHTQLGRRYLRKTARKPLPPPRYEKRLDVVIMGAPNAGKSVLLNALVGEKVAACSRKRHTTRSEILGVFNHRNVQLAFYDTPGYIAKSASKQADVKTLRSFTEESAAQHADVVLVVVDAVRSRSYKFHDTFAEMVKIGLSHAKKEVILVLNKVDLVEPKVELLDTTRMLVSLINGVKLKPEELHLAALDTTTFMVSALHNDGVTDISNYLLSLADLKPWVVPKGGGVSGLSWQGRVEEMVLESLLDHTHEEIPYICDVVCKSMANLTPTRIKFEVNILVDTPSQQRIIIGQQARTLVKVRQATVASLERIFGKEVILMLWVNLRDRKSASDMVQ